MGMEGIAKNDSPSQEQIERQEKCQKSFDKLISVAELLTDSGKADDLAESIGHFGDKFNHDKKNNKNLKLEKYSLGAALLNPGEIPNILNNISEYEYDDTEDDRIEKFITKIFEETKMTSEQMARSTEREEKIYE